MLRERMPADNYREVLSIVKDADNIYMDTSTVPWFIFEEEYPWPAAVNIIEESYRHVGPEKLMWASDYPGMLNHGTMKQLISSGWETMREYTCIPSKDDNVRKCPEAVFQPIINNNKQENKKEKMNYEKSIYHGIGSSNGNGSERMRFKQSTRDNGCSCGGRNHCRRIWEGGDYKKPRFPQRRQSPPMMGDM